MSDFTKFQNYPLLTSLDDIQLKHLEHILPHFKDILYNFLETQNYVELINKIKSSNDKTFDDITLKNNSDINIEKRAEELSDERTEKFHEEIKNISEEKDSFESMLNEKNKENESNIQSNSILKQKYETIQNELNNKDTETNEKIKRNEDKTQEKIDKLEKRNDIQAKEHNNLRGKKENEINILRKDKDSEIKQLREDKDNVIKDKDNVIKDKDNEIKELNANLSIMTNHSQKKGVIGENLTETKYVPKDWSVKTKSQTEHSGDHEFKNPKSNNIICVDSKYYNCNVPAKDVDKLKKDVNTTNSDGGIIISHKSGISWNHRPLNSISWEIFSSKPFLFISNANDLSPQTIKDIIIMFDVIISSIKGDERGEDIIKITKKINLSIQSLNNNIEKIKEFKNDLISQKKSFDRWNQKLSNDTKRMEIDFSESINIMEQEIYLFNNNSELIDILSKSPDSGFSTKEMEILLNDRICNLGIVNDSSSEQSSENSNENSDENNINDNNENAKNYNNIDDFKEGMNVEFKNYGHIINGKVDKIKKSQNSNIRILADNGRVFTKHIHKVKILPI